MNNSIIKNNWFVIPNTVKQNIYFSLIALALLITSCGNKEEAKEEEAAPEANATEVTITKEQAETIKIQLGSIVQKNLTSVLKTSGFLKVPPQNKASITSAMGGTVQTILVQEGDYVQKGQTLLTLFNPDFIKLQQDYLEAQSQITFAEAEYNRQKELSEKNVSSQKVFQQAQSDFNSLKAKLSSLKQQLSLLGINTAALTHENLSSAINIKSPVSGSISHIDINIGSSIEHSTPMMRVVDNSQLHLDLSIYEQDLMKVKVGQTVSFTLTNLSGKSFTAKIFAIGNAFENETKSISVHANITGEKTGLIEGMNVTAMIDIGNNLSPAVPSAAITSSAGNDFIFIELHNHKPTAHEHTDEETKEVKEELGDQLVFRKVQVRRGVTDGGYTEIAPLEEIPADAKVVINGAFYLMAMLTNAGEEE